MTNLEDFTGDGGLPRLSTVRAVEGENTKGAVGTFVRVHNRDMAHLGAYYSTREEEAHLFRKFDAYGISEDILQKADKAGVKTVFIYAHEEDSRNLYEFTLEQYLKTSQTWVHEGDDARQVEDKQRFVSREDAVRVFEGVSSGEFFVEDSHG